MGAPWTYESYINGAWTSADANGQIDVIDPATEEVVGHVVDAGPKQAVAAIDAARRAFDDGPWPWMTVKERAKVLSRMAEILDSRRAELADQAIAEAGCTVRIADLFQIGNGIDSIRYAAEWADHLVEWMTPMLGAVTPGGIGGQMIVREPVGVVGAITPFNFPFFMNALKASCALAAGCSVVLKPHPWTPLNAFELAKAAEEAGLPPGVLNVVVGGADVGEEITTSPKVDMIAFTGSTATGKHIREVSSSTLKRVQLELGGKSAQIVLDDTPEEHVAQMGLRSVIGHAGQVCVTLSRLLLPERYLDAFIEGAKATTPSLTVGPTRDPATVVGPLIREQQRARVEGLVQSGIDEGATLVVGGKRPEGLDKGFFYEPTLFVNCDNSMRICQEEIFGPVLSVITYRDEQEAIRIANDSIYGLSGAVVTANTGRGFNVARQIRTGTVAVTTVRAGNEGGESPGAGEGPGWGGAGLRGLFGGANGGFKQSGVGREMGKLGLEDFTEVKSLTWT
jgi:aldehyde dehydrogenase (NAD+)